MISRIFMNFYDLHTFVAKRSRCDFRNFSATFFRLKSWKNWKAEKLKKTEKLKSLLLKLFHFYNVRFLHCDLHVHITLFHIVFYLLELFALKMQRRKNNKRHKKLFSSNRVLLILTHLCFLWMPMSRRFAFTAMLKSLCLNILQIG